MPLLQYSFNEVSSQSTSVSLVAQIYMDLPVFIFSSKEQMLTSVPDSTSVPLLNYVRLVLPCQKCVWSEPQSSTLTNQRTRNFLRPPICGGHLSFVIHVRLNALTICREPHVSFKSPGDSSVC